MDRLQPSFGSIGSSDYFRPSSGTVALLFIGAAMNILDKLETQQSKQEVPALRAGETVRVHVKVVEGEKERTQVFEGIVIGIGGKGNRANFVVRKISYGVGVERIFPFHSPRIDKVEVVSRGRVRRAKLYYLRERSGKAARLFSDERSGNR